MIDIEITSNRSNYIWLCDSSLDGYTLQLQNGVHPRDVAHYYTSSGNIEATGNLARIPTAFEELLLGRSFELSCPVPLSLLRFFPVGADEGFGTMNGRIRSSLKL